MSAQPGAGGQPLRDSVLQGAVSLCLPMGVFWMPVVGWNPWVWGEKPGVSVASYLEAQYLRALRYFRSVWEIEASVTLEPLQPLITLVLCGWSISRLLSHHWAMVKRCCHFSGKPSLVMINIVAKKIDINKASLNMNLEPWESHQSPWVSIDRAPWATRVTRPEASPVWTVSHQLPPGSPAIPFGESRQKLGRPYCAHRVAVSWRSRHRRSRVTRILAN